MAHPALVAGGTEVAALAGESEEMLVPAIRAAEAEEAGGEVAAAEEGTDHGEGTPLLADPAAVARLDRAILAVTGGRPLIVNLEGVMADPMPADAHPMKIGMAEQTALARLKAWRTRGVILANNHTLDFGPEALAAMRHALETAGIACVGDGECVDFGPFRLAAATDWLNPPAAARNRITADRVAAWRDTPPPWIAFFHCGKEYSDAPGARERLLGERAGAAGAGLVLGCHPHRPSPGWEAGAGALTFVR